MKTIRLTVDLTYDDDAMHSVDADPEAREWFERTVLRHERLVLHSNEVGDAIGTVKVVDDAES